MDRNASSQERIRGEPAVTSGRCRHLDDDDGDRHDSWLGTSHGP